MDIKNMTEQIINGRRLTKNDDLSFLLNTELDVLTECADKLRKHFSGGTANLCSIINGRSGRCSEDCKFCAQSAHHCTGIEERAFLSGANSAITGDMLTTSGNRIREDIAMLNRIGYSTGRDNNA